MTTAQELRGIADQLDSVDISDHTTFLAIRGRLKQIVAGFDGDPIIARPKKAPKPVVDGVVIHYDFAKRDQVKA